MQRFLRTKLATDWEEPPADTSIVKRMLRKLELKIDANPTYVSKMHLVKEWLIEFDDEQPWREIGIGRDGEPVLAGPTSVDYGFWLDTNMEYANFEGTNLEQSEFESYWKKAATVRAGNEI